MENNDLVPREGYERIAIRTAHPYSEDWHIDYCPYCTARKALGLQSEEVFKEWRKANKLRLRTRWQILAQHVPTSEE